MRVKRILCLLLSIAMIIGTSVSVFADDTVPGCALGTRFIQ